MMDDTSNRWYEAGIGRYPSPDPIGLASGDNLYRYAQENPLVYVDPSGLQLVEPPGRSFTPDPLNPLDPVPPDCSAGGWTFAGYDYRTTERSRWRLVGSWPLRIARIGPGPRGGGSFTLGCTCEYEPGAIVRTTQQWSKWTQKVTCSPCFTYERTAYNYEQTFQPLIIPVIYPTTARRRLTILGDCMFCPGSL